jgi:hypothetical protein
MSNKFGPPTAQDLARLIAAAKRFPDYPAEFVPPAWVNSDYVPPYDGRPAFVANVVMTTVVLLVFCLRMFIRGIWRKSTWGWDDWVIIPATAFTLALGADGFVNIWQNGFGHHTYDLTFANVSGSYMSLFVQSHLYTWAACFIKLSLLLFYLRLLPDSSSSVVRFIKGLFMYHILLAIVTTMVLFFDYTPIRAAWDLSTLSETSTTGPSPYVRVVVLSSLFGISDLIVWIIPIQLVWRSNATKGRRLGLVALFSLGGLAVIAIVGRTVAAKNIYHSYDGTWKGVSVVIWTQFECCVGIVAASLPALSSAARQIVGKDSSRTNIRRQLYGSISSTPYQYEQRFRFRPQRYRSNMDRSSRFANFGQTREMVMVDDGTAPALPQISNDRTQSLPSNLRRYPPRTWSPHLRNIINFSSTDESRSRSQLAEARAGSSMSVELVIPSIQLEKCNSDARAI